MLESAQNLLVISKDEAKVTKLQDAVQVHQSNIDRIEQQLVIEKGKYLIIKWGEQPAHSYMYCPLI